MLEEINQGKDKLTVFNNAANKKDKSKDTNEYSRIVNKLLTVSHDPFIKKKLMQHRKVIGKHLVDKDFFQRQMEDCSKRYMQKFVMEQIKDDSGIMNTSEFYNRGGRLKDIFRQTSKDVYQDISLSQLAKQNIVNLQGKEARKI